MTEYKDYKVTFHYCPYEQEWEKPEEEWEEESVEVNSCDEYEACADAKWLLVWNAKNEDPDTFSEGCYGNIEDRLYVFSHSSLVGCVVYADFKAEVLKDGASK